MSYLRVQTDYTSPIIKVIFRGSCGRNDGQIEALLLKSIKGP